MLNEVAGLKASLYAMRHPKKTYNVSDTTHWEDIGSWKTNKEENEYNYWITREVAIGERDLDLAQRLILAGTSHSKFLRGIVAWITVSGPWYWWNEMDTYCVGRTPLSSTSSMHIDCAGLTGEELVAAKSAIRGDFQYTRTFTVNYQCLRNIYFQRRNHRLPEWQQFCDFILSLPLSNELITIQKEKKTDE
jgi:hypothetical protein